MAISPDVLATALQDLAPGYSELFSIWHPLMERVVLKGNVDRATLKGPYREFVVVSDGPGTVTQVLTGSEVIAGGRRQNAQRGDTYAPRLIYAFDVPGKDMAEANGENDLARIIKRYPELALSDFHERIADQLGGGNSTAGVGGFLTLNGDQTYNPEGTARTGVFKYDICRAPASTGRSRPSLLTVVRPCVRSTTLPPARDLRQAVLWICSSVTRLLTSTTSTTWTIRSA